MFKSKITAKSKAKEQAIAQDSPVANFLQVWQAMKAETKDRMRLHRLELRVDSLWLSLTQAQKDAAWMICFPEHREA